MTKDEALKLALETLQFYASVCNEDDQLTPAKTAIAKCKAALAQLPLPVQEPAQAASVNPYSDYRAKYWQAGFDGEEIDATFRGEALVAWSRGRSAATPPLPVQPAQEKNT